MSATGSGTAWSPKPPRLTLPRATLDDCGALACMARYDYYSGMTEIKVCTKCSASKPLCDFYPQPTGRLGLMAECKKCNNARVGNNKSLSRRREKMAERYLADPIWQQKRHQALREKDPKKLWS